MTTYTTSYYDIVSQLPAGTVVRFTDVSWDQYEDLLQDAGEDGRFRISFDRRALEVRTLSTEHGRFERFFERFVTIVGLRLGVDIISAGSATMRSRRKQKGIEPDACFYVQNAALIGSRLNLDFDTDPPPDIAVEVDISHDSMKKLDIYAALGIPEVWRFDGSRLCIFLLSGDQYVESAASPALPILTSQVLTGALAQMRSQGQTAALKAFDEWLKATKGVAE
ncbi:MAG TPA: Uma2 family endonuclease [Blastocatellia bacterium]